MKNKDEGGGKGVLQAIEGIQPVAPGALEEFKQAMKDSVIPEIVKVVQKRRVLAAESRQRQLKY